MFTKFEIMAALFNGTPLVEDRLRGQNFLIVNAVEREDGSGKSFNVTGIDAATGGTVTRCVRTLD